MEALWDQEADGIFFGLEFSYIEKELIDLLARLMLRNKSSRTSDFAKPFETFIDLVAGSF